LTGIITSEVRTVGRFKYFYVAAWLAVMFASPSAQAVGLGVGLFGGYALPSGDMLAGDGFDLRPSPALGARAFFDVHKHFGADVAAAYNFEFTPGVKFFEERAEHTKLLPVNVGAYYKLEVTRFRFSAGGGVGYYFLKTKVLPPMERSDAGFGVAMPVWVTFNAPGLYAGGAASYTFGKFAVTLAPRYHYIFNSGEYDGETIYGGDLTVEKNWDDSYFEILAGVTYDIF
jgi:hypothetical protein